MNLTRADQQSGGPTYCCPAISAHGRYVAFESEATDLVAGDTNEVNDVFVRDRLTGDTTRISVATDEDQSNGGSSAPSMSNSGQVVAFMSDATNLVPGDTNGVTDIFLRDLTAGTTVRVSLTSNGNQANDTSGDPVISGNGRQISFISDATNIVPGDTNGLVDVFVRNRSGTVTDRVSVSSTEDQGDERSFGPAISRTGRFVAFTSAATNLVAADTNDSFDVFLRDRETGKTERVSVGPGGREGVGGSPFDTGFAETVSGDGRYVTFDSDQSNLVERDTNDNFDAFVRDRKSERTTLVSRDAEGDQIQGLTFLASSDRRAGSVLLLSYDENVVPGDDNGLEDLFVRDRRTGDVGLVTIAVRGEQTDDALGGGTMSTDGSHVTFLSFATNLVPNDTNGEGDIFVRDDAADLR
ncbi:MAG: hypothetical protein WKH47_09095 [Actinomycetes bacterium]